MSRQFARIYGLKMQRRSAKSLYGGKVKKPRKVSGRKFLRRKK